jgi:hypothetical protein
VTAPLPRLKDAETGQTDFVALLAVPCRQRPKCAQRGPACFFDRSWLSDKAAAKCLNATVTRTTDFVVVHPARTGSDSSNVTAIAGEWQGRLRRIPAAADGIRLRAVAG